MPHDTRRFKPQRKKPKRSRPLGITDPATLRIHRELQVLRIAGGAKPGEHKDALMAKRFRKLDESEGVVTAVTPRPLRLTRGEVNRINDMPMEERLRTIKLYLS